MTLFEHNLTFEDNKPLFIDFLHYYNEVPTIIGDLGAEWPLEFYRQYVAKNQPVLIKGGCRHFPATHLWNAEYFRYEVLILE